MPAESDVRAKQPEILVRRCVRVDGGRSTRRLLVRSVADGYRQIGRHLPGGTLVLSSAPEAAAGPLRRSSIDVFAAILFFFSMAVNRAGNLEKKMNGRPARRLAHYTVYRLHDLVELRAPVIGASIHREFQRFNFSISNSSVHLPNKF